MALAVLVIAWVIGLITAEHAAQSPIGWLALALITVPALFLVRGRPRARWLLLALFAFGLGAARFAATLNPLTDNDLQRYNDSQAIDMTGTIVDMPDIRDSDTQLRVQIDSLKFNNQVQPVSGLALVTADRNGNYAYGDRINLYGALLTPPSFDSFDYRDYLAISGVHSLIELPSITVTAHNQGNPLVAFGYTLKNRAHQLIDQWLASPSSALLTGILLGIRTDLPTDVRSAFDSTGTTRILAIDGSKMAIVIGLCSVLLGGIRPKWLSSLAIIVAIALYTAFVGAQPPVLRAAIMGGLAIIATQLRRESDGLSALAFSVWLLTLVEPTELNDAAFWLSVTATLGLVIAAGPVNRWLEENLSRLISRQTIRLLSVLILDSLTITMIVLVASLPIQLLIFKTISPVGFLVNVLITPAQMPIMALGLPALAVGLVVSPLGQLLAWVIAIPLAYTLAIVRAAATLPSVSQAVAINPWLVGSYYLIGFGLWWSMQQPVASRIGLLNRLRKTLLTPVTILLVSGIAAVIWVFVLARPDGRLHLWVLDVPGGGALIQTPEGAHILIDGGNAPTQLAAAIGDRLPFGSQSLDSLIVTDPNGKAFSALPDLLGRYRVQTALINFPPVTATVNKTTDQSTNTLVNTLTAARTPVVPLSPGFSLQTTDGVQITLLGQEADQTLATVDQGLAVRISYGQAVFLLASGISANTEQVWLNDAQDIQATVLLLPDHGNDSLNGADFLQAVNPQAAVIQVDSGNRAALPPQSTLDRLKGHSVFRTDQHGTIDFATDGNALWVQPERQP